MHLAVKHNTFFCSCRNLQTLRHRKITARTVRNRRGNDQQAVRAFTITLDTPEGEKKIECDGDTYILDAADAAGLDLPYSCRSGSCGTCAAKVNDISQIDQVRIKNTTPPCLCILRCGHPQYVQVTLQDDNSYLEGDMLNKGYFLTCTSYPKADVTIMTDQEDNVFD